MPIISLYFGNTKDLWEYHKGYELYSPKIDTYAFNCNLGGSIDLGKIHPWTSQPLSRVQYSSKPGPKKSPPSGKHPKPRIKNVKKIKKYYTLQSDFLIYGSFCYVLPFCNPETFRKVSLFSITLWRERAICPFEPERRWENSKKVSFGRTRPGPYDPATQHRKESP